MRVNQGVMVGFVLFLLSAIHASAIEGLKLSVECEDVVLSWPSAEGKTYIVQYRPVLETNASWQTLTNFMPADAGTNLTVFIHAGVITNPACSGGGFSMMAASGGEFESASQLEMAFESSVPQVLQGDGTVLPLNIYPPGFDFSGLVIWNPVMMELLEGSLLSTEGFSMQASSLDPENIGEGSGGGESTALETGFYRVVRNGIHLMGVSNGMVLSGVVTIPVEVGAVEGRLVLVSVRENGVSVGNSARTAPFELPLQVVLDTTMMSNGVHEISGYASWRPSGEEDGGMGMGAESPVFTVTVYNEISFPEWLDHFGELYDSVLITAQLARTNVDWEIDVYGNESGYIGTFWGHSVSGRIYGWWDLIGPGNQSHAHNRYFDFVVTVYHDDGQSFGAQAAGSSSSTNRTYRQNDNWTSKGMWVVANQQAFQGNDRA